MSSRERQPSGGGLSLQTLVIASVASMAAAIVVREIWKGGAIVGAAFTPVVVAIVSETLRRPADRLSSIRTERYTRGRVARRSGADVPVPPPPELERPDPFGIWQADRPPTLRERFSERRLKLALLTGVVAFALGAIVLTSSELVFGGSVAGGGGTTLGGGGGHHQKSTPATTQTTTTTSTSTTETTPTTTETTPSTDTQTAPGDQQTTATTPAPGQTTTAPTATTPAPATATPTPDQQQTTPAPGGAQVPPQSTQPSG